jgi:hypothetical protein
MANEFLRTADDLSNEEKIFICYEIEKLPEELKKQRKTELAEQFGVDPRTIRSIAAWTKIRAKKLVIPNGEKNKLTTSGHRHLIHRQILRDHYHFNYAVSRSTARTRYEIHQIFKNFYKPQEIDLMIDEVASEELGKEKSIIHLQDVDAKAGERVNYNNDKKNASREWWLNLLWQYTQNKDKSKFNLILLPGPECYELSPVISMGYPPENIRCYNLGEDPLASAVFIRNCQNQGAFNWRLGDLKDLLPAETQRINGGNLDFTGFYSRKSERILSYLPVPKNGHMYFSINLEKKRERRDTTSKYRQIVSYASDDTIETKKLSFTQRLLEKARAAISACLNHAQEETPDARKEALEILFEENIGIARTENWLCFEEVREMVHTSGIFPDFDNFEAYEKVNAAKCVMTTFEDELIGDLAQALQKIVDKDMSQFTGRALSLMMRRGCFNETNVMHSHQYEYCSPTGSPFISHFIVCENLYDEYRAMDKSMQFFIKCMTVLIKNIHENNSEEVNQKMRSNEMGEVVDFHTTAHFLLRGDKLIFQSKNPPLTIEIPLFQLQKDVNKMLTFIKHLGTADRHRERLKLALSNNQESLVNSSPQENRPKSQKATPHTLPHGQIMTSSVKIGRNDRCHCGSGLKFKNCCYQKD